MNHFTNDFTKILMTPITDIDYYLPKFSKFQDKIFRDDIGENSPISVTKVTNICLNFKNENKNKNELTKDKKEKDNIIINPIYELNKEYFFYLKEKETEENIINNNSFNPEDFDIFTKFIYNKHLYKRGKSLQCGACLVKLPFHIRGIIYINYKEIGFYSYETKKTEKDEDYDIDKKTCFGSVFKEKSDKFKNYNLKIPFMKIELILKRRYYFKRNVLEIFTQNKKSYFFQIDENNFKDFFDKIISNNVLSKYSNDFEEITIENGKTEEKIGLINKSNILFEYNNYKSFIIGNKKILSIKNIYHKWIRWEISTFTLLNYLNLFSSRSYNDINQYPVFPWIITEYTKSSLPDLSTPSKISSTEHISYIRPFNKPMGMIDIIPEAKERKEKYLEAFDSKEEDKEESEERYGSHYSTSLYLTHYLVRVFPFSYLRIELQGKEFDDPNRLFNSLANSFFCAITQKSDLRELIPEFFCFPEMFYNYNNLNLGEILDEKTHKKKLVNEIEMPPWSLNDAYIFIKYHREMLESIEISEKIHEWFNIIFGSKQKGKSAKHIHNLFLRQTYDDFDEIHKKENSDDKIFQKRMVEFGVTPSQIFKNDVDKRLSIKLLGKKPILYDYHLKKGKVNLGELKIRESELYIEGEPYKVFSSWKKNEEQKNEKILLLYKDKIKIISKIEKDFFKKRKSSNTSNKNIKQIETNKIEEKKREEIKEEKEEENKEEINIEEKPEIVEENNNEINLDKDISRYDKIFFCPKYRTVIEQSPALIYDKGNYLILGGFWNGQIVINNIDNNQKNKKVKTQKLYNIISTNKMSPITIMKIDQSETFLFCVNKIGCIFIYSNNRDNKIEWDLNKVIQDNQKEITSFDLNENLNIFITSDKEGYINLYTFPKCKLFNSFRINENQLLSNNILKDNINNNSSITSSSESNITIFSSQNDYYADIVIISQSPLPAIIFYIHSKKILSVFSINFHYINSKNDIEIVPNGIKKYSDYFRKDYLFIYNNKEKTIDIYDIINLENVLKTCKFEYTFIDFCFSKEMENILILVKIDDEKLMVNSNDKNNKKNYKILKLNTRGNKDKNE